VCERDRKGGGGGVICWVISYAGREEGGGVLL
jgi:hypothetical protein